MKRAFAILAMLLSLCGLAHAVAIKVLVVVTTEAVSHLIQTPEELAANEVFLTNSALGKSGLAHTVTHVGTLTGFSQQGLKGIPLLAMVRNSYAITKKRKDVNADVVIVITDDSTGGRAASIPATSASDAFAITDWANGAEYGFQHEFGHMLGAKHQSSGGISIGGVSTNDTTPGNAHGAYLRVAGYYGTSYYWGPYCGRDIMAYPNINGSQLGYDVCNGGGSEVVVPWYSAPGGLYVSISNSSGATAPWGPIGDSTHDNATAIASNFANVATFRNTDLSAPYLAGKLNSIIRTLLLMDP